MHSSDPVHEITEPERCEECRGDGFTLSGAKCEPCQGRGGYPKGWYFCDEVWVDRYGPYKTREEANEACRKYAEQL